jgi:hypothetical protein
MALICAAEMRPPLCEFRQALHDLFAGLECYNKGSLTALLMNQLAIHAVLRGGKGRPLLLEVRHPEKSSTCFAPAGYSDRSAWPRMVSGTQLSQGRYRHQQMLRKDNPMPVADSTKTDRFASAAEDVAAVERAIQEEIERKEKTRPKAETCSTTP